ncbi:MAG: YraN family protein [Clostridia bacterium]|nr:YraN family protein [Clostridia bacterium]
MAKGSTEKRITEKKITEKRRIGNEGEDLACKYLIKHGYKIVDRNFACKIGEIDIIAFKAGRAGSAEFRKKATLCFVEVKSRNSLAYGLPCQAVSFPKQRRIILTAQAYWKRYLKGPGRFGKFAGFDIKDIMFRFDIVEILRLPEGDYIRHLENAFSANS